MPRTGRPRVFDRSDALVQAKELFWTRGYGETSIQDLVDALGVERGSIYGAFGDKRSLYLETVALYWRDNRAALEAALHEGPVLPVLRRMLTQPAVLTGPGQSGQRRGCLIGNTTAALAGTDAQARAVVSDAFEQFVEIVSGALRRAQASGEVVATAAPQTQALLVLVLFQGSSLLAKALDDHDRLDAVVDLALGVLTPS